MQALRQASRADLEPPPPEHGRTHQGEPQPGQPEAPAAARVPRGTSRVRSQVEAPVREQGTQRAGLPMATPHGQLPGMPQPAHRQQASAGQLQEEPRQVLSDLLQAAREQGPLELLRVSAWMHSGLRAELPPAEADAAPSVGRRQGRLASVPQAAQALPVQRPTGDQKPEQARPAPPPAQHLAAGGSTLAKALRGSG